MPERKLGTATQAKISVVVPVYNEEALISETCTRLFEALAKLGQTFELIIVDDGSSDRSVGLLREFYHQYASANSNARIKIVLLRTNAGQHAAILAGFRHASGECVVTIDADLQNSPDDIGLLYDQFLAGYDYVGSIREKRRDVWWRDIASKAMNGLRERITSIHMTDQGSMFRLYDISIIKVILDSNEAHTFIPALGGLYARNPVEVTVPHYERKAGESKYSLFSLIHLNFDLVTGFSVVPLQFISILGMSISGLSFIFVVFMFARRIFIGPEAEGVFTLFAISFFMMGLLLAAVGILGEYVGRIYTEVRSRPRYLVSSVLDSGDMEIDAEQSKPALNVELAASDNKVVEVLK